MSLQMQRRISKIILWVMLLSLIYPLNALAQENDKGELMVDGVEYQLPSPPEELEIGVCLPLSILAESTGKCFQFNSESKTALLIDDVYGEKILSHNATKYCSNGEVIDCRPLFFVQNGIPMIAVSFFCEIYNATFSYDTNTKSVSLTTASRQDKQMALDESTLLAATTQTTSLSSSNDNEVSNLSGTLNLSDGQSAPVGGLSVRIVIRTASQREGIYGNVYYEWGNTYTLGTNIIAEGENSASYSYSLSPYITEEYPFYATFYEMDAPYGGAGYYNADGETKYITDRIDTVSSGSLTFCSLHENSVHSMTLLYSTLSGTISLPQGEIAPKGGLTVDVIIRTVSNTRYTKYGVPYRTWGMAGTVIGTEKIEENTNSVDYLYGLTPYYSESYPNIAVFYRVVGTSDYGYCGEAETVFETEIHPSDIEPQNDMSYQSLIRCNNANISITPSLVEPLFSGGDGTAGNPYMVSTPEQLDMVRYFPDSHFMQINDIDLSQATTIGGKFYHNGDGWIPIGSSLLPFRGSYDGCGHVISGLHIDSNSDLTSRAYAGLFASNSGTICNLGIVGGNIRVNCNFRYRGNTVAGGITGWNDGQIENCFNENKIDAYAEFLYYYIAYSGGITGYNNGSVQKSYNTGDITAHSYRGANSAGIAGVNSGSIENCYNTGSIIADSSSGFSGGIAGTNNGGGSCCYNVGEVVRHSSVTAASIVGINEDGTITDTYYLENYSSYNREPYGTKLQAAEMQKASSFVGFDFENVWEMNTSSDYVYPTLHKYIPPHNVNVEVFEKYVDVTSSFHTDIEVNGKLAIFVIYKNNIMNQVKTTTIYNNKAEVKFDNISGEVILKVFVWESLDSLKPVLPIESKLFSISDFVQIPDPLLKKALNYAIDSERDSNSTITTSDIESIKTLVVDDKITDLEGLQYAKNLENLFLMDTVLTDVPEDIFTNMPNLKQLALWSSAVEFENSLPAIQKLQAVNKNVSVCLDRDLMNVMILPQYWERPWFVVSVQICFMGFRRCD